MSNHSESETIAPNLAALATMLDRNAVAVVAEASGHDREVRPEATEQEGRAEVVSVPLRIITPGDVRASIKRAKRSLEKAAEEIVWQVEMEAWKTLGYTSWSVMREAEYGGAAFMVPARQRPELVARMRATGLTQQDIADTAGVSRTTVVADLNADSDIEPPATITNSRGQQRPATYTPDKEKADPVAAESAPTQVTCPTCGGTGKVTQ